MKPHKSGRGMPMRSIKDGFERDGDCFLSFDAAKSPYPEKKRALLVPGLTSQMVVPHAECRIFEYPNATSYLAFPSQV
jgi:hypothetical protein